MKTDTRHSNSSCILVSLEIKKGHFSFETFEIGKKKTINGKTKNEY